MKMVRLPFTDLDVSAVIYGCMRVPRDAAEARQRFHAAIEGGINFFDHADIYGGGHCETVFGTIWDDGVKREDVIVQSKCGIRPGRYDFSYDHILAAVDGSLERLQTDHLDILLLHRPDVLMEPDEVAKAFDALKSAGKVRHFGVSNQPPWVMAMLRQTVRQPLIANQIQLSLTFAHAFDSYIVRGYGDPGEAVRGDGTLEDAILNGHCLQAYGPLGAGKIGRDPEDNAPEPIRQVHAKVKALAAEHDCSVEAIALAWLLRHPANILPIIGTANIERIAACCQAPDVELSREEWYELYVAARGRNMP